MFRYFTINSTCNRNTLQLKLLSPKRHAPRGQKSVSVEERFKQESMYELSAPKSGRRSEFSRCEEVAASGDST